MANDGRELTISVEQSYPSAGAVSTTGSGGTWPAGTYSFKVVAWYTSGEALEDNAGVIRTNVAAWAGEAVSLNDSVTVTWTAANRVPDHYSVYYIEAGSWVANGVLRGRRIAKVNGDVLTSGAITKPFVQQGESTNLASTTTSEDGASPTTVLHDTTAKFSTNGVKAGDSISNVTDASTATVVTVDSNIKLTTTALAGGTDNKYESGDSYRVTSTTMLDDTAATFVTNGVAVGDYVILNATASKPGEYAKVTAVVSETVLTTAALTDDAVYTLADSYDVVNNIFIPSAAATSFTINPVKDMPFELRKMMIRAYNGLGVTKSYAQPSPFNKSRIEFFPWSLSEANYKKICLWIYQGVRVKITESSGASALVQYRTGYFTGASHLPTRYKNSRILMWVDFFDETGSLT